MHHEGINSPDLPAPVGPFSHLVKVGAFVLLSGQVAQDPDTDALIAGDARAQAAQIFENIQWALRAVGYDLSHVVNATVYLTDMRDYAALNAVYATCFMAPYPARTTVAVAALPLGARVEIDDMAHQ
jgi:2-iminobutanoate/2-iminopropanoate deaminase